MPRPGPDRSGWSPELAAKATSWAQHLADTGTLAHSVLTQGVPAGWHALGENVGYAGVGRSVHSGFLNSPEHRQNMLNPKWRVMGIGAVHASGYGLGGRGLRNLSRRQGQSVSGSRRGGRSPCR